MSCATCGCALVREIGMRGRPPSFCSPCVRERERERSRVYQRRHYAMHKDAIKLRREALAESRARGVPVEQVLAAWATRP